MGRTLSDLGKKDNISSLLAKLVNPGTGYSDYAQTMYELGNGLGNILNGLIDPNKSISLASTVEDADYLSKGIIDLLEQKEKHVLMSVYWNKHFKPYPENNISIAPIIKEFHEPDYKGAEILIIAKSIIASSCVVRTNLTNLIEESNPEKIFIVAPVILHGAIKSLEREFSKQISDKFTYIYFAKDTEKTQDGIVIPGIGGNVYERLGFGTQDLKNKFIPNIVKERRYRHNKEVA